LIRRKEFPGRSAKSPGKEGDLAMLTETSRNRIILAIALLALAGCVVASVAVGAGLFQIVMIGILAVSAAIIATMFAVVVN
jgi:hypothetical protein